MGEGREEVEQASGKHNSPCLETLLWGSLPILQGAGWHMGSGLIIAQCEGWPLPQVTDGNPNPKEPRKPQPRSRF